MRTIPASLPHILQNLLKDPIKYAKDVKKLNFDKYIEILKITIKHLKNIEPIIRLNNNYEDCMIVGDLHGDLTSISTLTGSFMDEKINSMIFLGDYVDRGDNSMAVLLTVIALKLAYPYRITVLKGNHEAANINRRYGFYTDLEKQFLEQSEEAMDYTDLMYNHLSIAAITPNGSLCCHGGIPNSIELIEELLELPKPYSNIMDMKDEEKRDRLFEGYHQMQWNDPMEDQEPDFDVSRRGISCLTFNDKITKKFLANNRLKRIIRAHQASRGGFQNIFDGNVLHVFSSEPYFGQIKKACVIHETYEITIVRDLNLVEYKRL